MSKFSKYSVWVAIVLTVLTVLANYPKKLTQQDIDGLTVTMPALAKEDFFRLATEIDPAKSAIWRTANLITEPPFEDWYGFINTKHSLKMFVNGQAQDGTKFRALYRIGLDSPSCKDNPKECASLLLQWL